MSIPVKSWFYDDNKVSDEDLRDEKTNEVDFIEPLVENEAKMFSFEQLQQLWHLFMNRSNARKRLDTYGNNLDDVR